MSIPVCGRSNDEGGSVLAPGTDPWVEERPKLLGESVSESVHVGAVCDVVEGQFASTVVQKDAHSLGSDSDIQRGKWGGRGCILVPIEQPHPPIASLGQGGRLSFPADRVIAHSQGPVGLFTHFHLPVVAARGEAFRCQDTRVDGEAPRTLRQIPQTLLHKLDALAVLGKQKVGMGSPGVKSQVSCRARKRNLFRLRMMSLLHPAALSQGDTDGLYLWLSVKLLPCTSSLLLRLSPSNFFYESPTLPLVVPTS